MNRQQTKSLVTIIEIANELIASLEAEVALRGQREEARNRRRTKAEIDRMKKDAMARRSQGEAVEAIAKRHGVSTAYIYMITTGSRGDARA